MLKAGSKSGCRYRELRRIMKEAKVSGTELAEAIGLQQGEISTRLCGKVPWKLHEMYAVLDHLGVEESAMAVVFPRDGEGDRRIDEEAANRGRQMEMIELGRELLAQAARMR